MSAPRLSHSPRLRKALGQHHLRYGHSCEPALEYLRPRGRTVLEIGPGGGVLTRELLAANASVLGWELDLAWTFELRRRLRGENLRIVAGDALDLPWERFPAGTLVAGNLPYAVATPILEAFLVRGIALPRGAFLVQEEVAARLTAAPGSRAYGFLTVLSAAQAEVTLLARIPRGSFRPPPKVHGAFVGVERRAPAVPPAELEGFRAVVAAAFAQRRKTVLNSLAAAYGRGPAEAALAAAAVDPARRAETLTLADFVALHRALRGASTIGARGHRKKSLEC